MSEKRKAGQVLSADAKEMFESSAKQPRNERTDRQTNLESNSEGRNFYDMRVFEEKDLVKYWKNVLRYHHNILDVIEQNAEFLLRHDFTHDYAYVDSTELRVPADRYNDILDILLRYHPDSWYIIERNLALLPPNVTLPGSFFWEQVSANKHAILFLEKNPHFIVWNCLAVNRNVHLLLTSRPTSNSAKPPILLHLPENERCDFYRGLLHNESAQEFLENHPDSPFSDGRVWWLPPCDPACLNILPMDELLEIWLYHSLMIPGHGRVISYIVAALLPYMQEKERKAFIEVACQTDNKDALNLVLQYISLASWPSLSANPLAINIVFENQEKIHWDSLSSNSSPAAIDLLATRPEKINWSRLSANSGAIELLSQNIIKIDTESLQRNCNAIRLLSPHVEKITQWFVRGESFCVSMNLEVVIPSSDPETDSSEGIVELISWTAFFPINLTDWKWLRQDRKLTDKMFHCLSNVPRIGTLDLLLVPEATFFFERYPLLIPLLGQHQSGESIVWKTLSRNHAAVEILRKNMERLDPYTVSYNTNISQIFQGSEQFVKFYKVLVTNPGATHILFPLNLPRITEKCAAINEELLQYFYEPSRVQRQAERNGISYEDRLQQIHHFLCL